MAYLGTPPQSGFITTAKQRVTSSTNAYVDLDHSISSIADVIVFVNFVKQDTTNLTLTTSTRITLGATLVSSDIVEIHYLGKAVNTQTPATGTVTADALAGSIGLDKLSATGTKSSSTFLAGDNSFKTVAGFDVTSITGATELSATPQKTDEFVMSDAGVLKRIDHEWMVNVNSPFAVSFGWSNDQSVAPNTATRITGFSGASTSESNQRTGTISTSPTGRITPGEQGYYYMQFIFNIAGMSDGEAVTAYVYSSHSDASYIVGQHIMSKNSQNPWVTGAFVGTVGNQNNNYFEFQAKHNHGSNRTIENGHYRIFKLATKNLP